MRAELPADAAAAIARGAEFYRAGAYREAEAVFVALGETAPDQPTLLRLRGLCRLRLGETAAALDLLRQAYEHAPADPMAALHYGLGLHEAGAHEAAVRLFAAAEAGLPADPAPPLNLAASLHALGAHVQAEAAARRARLRAPRLAQPRYMLGLTAMAQGRLATAEAEFDAALRRDAGLVPAWVSLGLLRYRREDIAGAIRALRRALALVPGHRVATANLIVFLRLSGLTEEAEDTLRAARETDPAAPELRLAAAVELLQEDDAEGALALLEGAPPAEQPSRAHWLAQRAGALLGCGRTAEAEQLLETIGEPPPPVRPLVLWRRVALAVRAGDGARARALAEATEAALDAAVMPEHRIIQHYQLARFWLGEGERARGFSFWVRGHRLLAQFQPFSRADQRAVTEANIAAFDRARLHAGARAGNDDPAPVFIVGMPRSGTTLAEQIIGAHAGGFPAGERPALAQAWRALAGQAGSAQSVRAIAALDAGALDVAAAEYLAALHALAPGAVRIVDKMPGNVQHLGLAALMLPGARIIHCTRDARDIGLSIFTRRFYGHHPYAHDLADLGWMIGETERLMAHWRAVLPNPILTLPMRDWIDDFDATLRRVLDFLDLPYDAGCERFYEQDSRVRTASRWQVREPVNARGLGRWREFEAELQPMIAELARAGMLDAPPTSA